MKQNIKGVCIKFLIYRVSPKIISGFTLVFASKNALGLILGIYRIFFMQSILHLFLYSCPKAYYIFIHAIMYKNIKMTQFLLIFYNSGIESICHKDS